LILGGCQVQAEERALPTLMQLPTATALPVTPTPRVLRELPAQPVTFTPLSASPTALDPDGAAAADVGQPAAATPLLLPTPISALAQPTRPPLDDPFVFGRSVQARDLSGRRLGTGEHVLMLVGGIHGGYEANTVALIEALTAHFEANPGDILPGITLVLIPQLNPDGIALGRTLAGRTNANGVDLNRNWGCGWNAEAYFRNQRISAGAEPFSEPETAALSALITTLEPAAVLFYHSAADGVFSGECGGDAGSNKLAAVLGDAAGYSFGADFSAYPVTGTAPAWVNSRGIPSADVELATADDPEFERNLRGLMAVQCWLTGQPVDCR
jgi:hypothetical protein